MSNIQDHVQQLGSNISMKRRSWQERRSLSLPSFMMPNPSNSMIINTTTSNSTSTTTTLQNFPGGFDDDHLISTLIPPVTVVLEGRSICQRISLHKHPNYQSLAKALRQMFVDHDGAAPPNNSSAADHHINIHGLGEQQQQLDLSNAVPGHLIAYEDMENDLLLVGDLNWKDFVRVAKRIRIVPVKANPRKGNRSMN